MLDRNNNITGTLARVINPQQIKLFFSKVQRPNYIILIETDSYYPNIPVLNVGDRLRDHNRINNTNLTIRTTAIICSIITYGRDIVIIDKLYSRWCMMVEFWSFQPL